MKDNGWLAQADLGTPKPILRPPAWAKLELHRAAHVAFENSDRYEAAMHDFRESLQAETGRDPVDVEPLEPNSPSFEGSNRSMDPADMTLEDVIDAEAGRPDFQDETADGLDDMEEDIRRQAEDLPSETPGRE